MAPCLALCAALSASAARAQEPSVDARIATMREMVLHARYAEAEQAADELTGRADLTAAQRNETLEIRAIVLIARRQSARAEQVLRELYGRDPEHRLIDRDVGPSVRALFERVQSMRPPQAQVTIENATPTELGSRESPRIEVRVAAGADVVHELRLSYRNGDSGPFERVIMRLDEARSTGRARAPLPEGTDAYVMRYYVEALAPSQAVVGSIGSAAEPLAVEVPAEAVAQDLPLLPSAAEAADAPGSSSVLEEWWFWTLVGVLVAGAGATVGVLYGTHVIGPPGGGTLGSGAL